MTNVLDMTLAAHGGWDHWQQLSKLTASASIGGGLWAAKGKGGILNNVVVEVDCHTQRAVMSSSPGRRSVYTPNRTTIETTDGKIVASRDNPRAAFEGHVTETQWDNLHLV